MKSTCWTIPKGVTEITLRYREKNMPSGTTRVIIPSGVTSIGDKAFDGCSSLTQIEIPSGVRSIGRYAFQHCRSLTQIEIPSGVTSIEFCAFTCCFSLTQIKIPSGVTSIRGSAFWHCKSLTQIEIPSGVTSIGDKAFDGCSSLTQINFPSRVTRIGEEVFSGCTSLTQIEIPEGIKEIEANAFASCPNLRIVNMPDSYRWHIPEGVENLTQEYIKINMPKVTLAVVIPSRVRSIGDKAFYDCSSITEINLPEGVTSIGREAFYYCASLTQINLPSGVTSIGEYAFYECTSLTRIEIPEGVTSIGEDAFAFCHSLTQINLPSKVTSIGDNAFSSCHSLTQIEIPAGVTSIGSGAFWSCRSIRQINLPAGVTSIGYRAFDGCRSLTQIEIPAGVTSIGWNAFSDCSSLTQINLPSGVTSIDKWAFNDCISLTQIEIPKQYHSAEERRRLGIDDKVRCIEPRAKTEKQKPASKKEEVRLEPKPVASRGAAAEEESKPKQVVTDKKDTEKQKPASKNAEIKSKSTLMKSAIDVATSYLTSIKSVEKSVKEPKPLASGGAAAESEEEKIARVEKIVTDRLNEPTLTRSLKNRTQDKEDIMRKANLISSQDLGSFVEWIEKSTGPYGKLGLTDIKRKINEYDDDKAEEPTATAKPASRKEEVKTKPVASRGAAAEEESKPKKADISEEELRQVQVKVSNLAKAQNVMASKAELGVASGIDAELVTWLQYAMEEVQGNASLKAYCDAMRITLRTSFMNVAMQDAGIDPSVLKKDSMLVSGVGSLLVTIGGEIPGVRSILEGITGVAGWLRNRSQKAYAKQLWGHIDKEVNHSTYILMISAGMTLGFKESLRIGRLDRNQSISQRSYAMVSGFFEELRHEKGTESALSEIGDSVASQDGMKDALGLVTSMMVVEPKTGSQRIKIRQLLELTGAIRDKRKGDKKLYKLDEVFELRERIEVISPIRGEEVEVDLVTSDNTEALLKKFMAEQKKQAEEQAREMAAMKAELEEAKKKLAEQPEKPEAGLKQSQVQKQAMALGLGVGVLSPEQESSGGAVTADELQMTKAESKDTDSQVRLLTEELAGVKERVDGLEHQGLKKEKSPVASCRMS